MEFDSYVNIKEPVEVKPKNTLLPEHVEENCMRITSATTFASDVVGYQTLRSK